MKWFYQNKWILLLAVVKFVLPFVLVGSVWELHRDEYLYYAQGQHLAFGYMECPPLLGWLGFISSLFGGSFFWVKFWPSLFGSFTLIVAAAIAKELGGRLFAQVLAAVGIILSAYLRTNFLFQPGFLEIFFWTLSAHYLLRLINTIQTKYYYLFSLALVAGWWSKYSVLFFAAALVAAIVLTYHRKLLANRHFWLAALTGFILIIPNILWQYSYNWPLAHHMQELQETQLQYIDKSVFLREQLLMLAPVAFVWISGLIWLLFNKKYRLVSYTYLGVIVLLMLGSGKGYYSLGAYPMLLAAGGVYLEKISNKRLWLRPVFIALIFIVSFPFLFMLLPLQSPQDMAATNKKFNVAAIGVLNWEDQQTHALQQDFADMIGWKELSTKAEHSFDSLTAKGYQNIVVYCGSYGQAGALQYYAQNPLFKQQVISRNGTFLLWIPQPLHFNHVLLIDDEWPEKEEPIFGHFTKITMLDSVANPLSRQLDDKIFLLQNADSVAVQMVNAEIAEKRRIFSRP